MTQFLGFAVGGLATSAIFAVAAVGLVLTYTTTGTFNFAHGAIGMIAAFAYWQLRFGWNWPAPVALFAVLVVLAPAFGAVLELAILRRLEGTPETTRLVVTISVLVGLLGIAVWIWRPTRAYPVRSFFQGHGFFVAGAGVAWDEVISLGVAAAVAVGLWVFLHRTRVGVAMRASVDDRGLARLTGARTGTVSMLAWAIGAALAALAGVLVAPTLQVSAVPLTLLIVNAYAAAMIGRLRSLPLTFLGALLLGLVYDLVPDYMQQWVHGTAASYLQGMYLSIPVIVLFVVLLVLPNPRLRGHDTSRAREIIPAPQWRGALWFAVAVVAVAALVGAALGRADLETVAAVFGIAIIALSLVPLSGFAGQLSLCQLSFAGIGAMVMAHLGNPFGLFAAAIVAGAVGALIALPALRLSGIYLSLGTAAFAVVMDRWVFTLPRFSVFGHRIDLFQGGELTVPRLWGAGGPHAELVVTAGVFGLCALAVVAIRRGRFGARLLALKDSPAACATLGMDVTRTKLAVFAASAALAGIGGALYGGALHVVSAGQFDFSTGLPILLVTVVAGIGTVGGPLAAGVILGSPILGNLFPGLPELPLLLSGLAGVGLAQNPNGFVLDVRARVAAVRPAVLVAQASAAVVILVLHIGGVIGGWPCTAGLIAVVAVGALAGLPRPEHLPPLEWAGLTRPFSAEDVEAIARGTA